MRKSYYVSYLKSFCFVLTLLIAFFLNPSSLSAQTASWLFEGGTGSANAENGKAVCTDASGNVYVTGSFANTVDFDFGAGVANLVSNGSNDIFIASYTSTGAYRWAVSAGGAASDNAGATSGICTDGVSVYATGNYSGAATLFGSTSLTPAGGSGTDGFVAKLNATTGAWTWAISLGGTGNTDYVAAICLDVSGNPYILGQFNNTLTTGSCSVSSGGGSELYVMKLVPGTGACTWATAGGSTLNDVVGGGGICYDPFTAQIVVASNFNGATATYGGFTLPNSGVNDMCVLELNSISGAFTQAVGTGTVNADDAIACVFDPATHDVFVTGAFNGASMTLPGGITLTNAGLNDSWVGRYSEASNTFTWGKSGGGTANDRANGICSDGSGNILVVGSYISNPATFGSQSLTNTNSGGFDDIFVVGYSATTGTEMWSTKNTNSGSQPSANNAKSIAIVPSSTFYWMTGQYAQGCTFGSLGALNSAGFNDFYVAKMNLIAPLTATQSQINVTCNGACNGSAAVVASGGVSPYTYSWSPSGGSSAATTNRCAGNYTCTITDAVSTSITKTFAITQPAVLVASVLSQTNISCNGGSNGAASVSVSGGTTAYSYNWTPGNPTGDGTASVTGLSVGTWTCTVTDANSCTTTQTFNITQPSTLVASVLSQTNISCNGGSNGAASVSVSGGTTAYSYNWTPGNPTGDGTASVTGLTVGTWTCTVTDAHGCVTTQTFNITQPSAIVVTPISQTNISCNGGSNGAASVSASGGTGSLSYNWTPGNPTGDGTNSVTGLTVGTWTCTVTDANSCTNTATFNITQPSALVASAASQTNISCNGGSNGAASVTVSGGTTAYSYNWTPGNPTGDGTASVTGLTVGTWTCTVTDANSCTTTQTFNITQPSALVASALSQTNISCNGGSNGAASVTVSGGTTAYSYNWTPGNPTGDGTASVTGLTVGTWTCTVTDANSCTTTQTFNVTQPSALVASALSQTNISCNGGSNGAASVTVSGGTTAYSYNWTPGNPTGDGTASVTGLTSGTWTCTVTDANSCTTTQTFNITQPSALVASAASQTNISCNGGSNGAASVSVSGGTTAYSYNWTPGNPTGDGTASVTGLTSGTWTCTVTDANSCTTTQTFNITQPSALTATSSSNPATCGGNNGSATAVPSGGIGPYTYSWSPSGGNAATASSLFAGSYTCTITDANGCITTTSVAVSSTGSITASITGSTNVSCNGGNNGSATAAPTGGTGPYTYSWAPSGGSAATASGLSPNTYTCTITDSNGCFASATVSITEPSAITATTSQTNIACNGGNTGDASVAASGGTPSYTYSWSPSGGNAATASSLTAGNYTCTITDANGCILTQTFNITQPSAISSSVSSQTNISCNGGSNGAATISASGGTGSLSYSWAPSGGNAATATGLSAGTYTCTITDSNGCIITQTVNITEPPALTATSSSTDATCGGNNGSATAVPSGGVGPYSYSWAPSGGTSATASSLFAGSYTCTVTDANGCITTTSVTVNSSGGISASITGSSNVSCNGGSNGSATAAPTGGTGPYTYSWLPSGGNSATETGLPAGSYTCTITDSNGCLATASVSITQPSAITASTSQTNISCNGSSNGTATVTPSGGTPAYTYSWVPSGGTAATASSLAPGTYTCTVTDANGCTLTQTFNITQPSALAETPSQTNISCNGGNNGSATVTVSGGTPSYTYVWSPSGGNAATASSLSAGTYTCNVTDANGCTISQTFSLTQPATAVSVVMSKTDATCTNSDGTATATPSGGTPGYTYLWNPSGQTIQTAVNLIAGTYTCTVTDANGCSTAGNITVNSTPCGPTQLVQCGVTLATLNQTLNCVAVPNATNYQYKIMQGATTVAIYTRGNYLTNIVLSNISTITYAQTYQISVRAMINSAWGTYGSACNVTTPAFPPGQVSPSSCGTTLASFTSLINCNSIVGATNYQWKFMQGTTLIATYLRGTNITDCQLANVPGTQYAQTYDVYVRGFVGGVWGPYGSFCNVTSPPFPTTQVSATYCGATLATISSGFSCDPVSGATNYQWNVVNAALGYNSTLTSSNNLNTWRLSNHPGVLGNTTYTVTVRAKVGGAWAPFGPACSLTTGHSARFGNPDLLDSSGAELDLQVYPNPTTGFINVDGGEYAINKVIVTDISGRVVNEFEPANSIFQINISDEENGIYFITIITDDSKKVVRIIKNE